MSDLSMLYRLADGTQADPADCSTNEAGVLVHNDGMPVALRADGNPIDLASEAVDNMNVAAAEAP